jgi:hypothetical protein
MSDDGHLQQQQHRPVYMESMPASPAAASAMLSVIKWITIGIVVPLILLRIQRIEGAYIMLEIDRLIASKVVGFGSVDGVTVNGSEEHVVAAANAWWKFLIILQWATLGAVALSGVFAFLAGLRKPWARIACTVLMLGSSAGLVVDAANTNLRGLIVIVPFLALVVLWWLPETSRGLRAAPGQRGVIMDARADRLR